MTKVIKMEWDSRGPRLRPPTTSESSTAPATERQGRMTKAQKEAQKAASALGEQYGNAARKFIKKAKALGGDSTTNLKAFMAAFVDTTLGTKPPAPKKAAK